MTGALITERREREIIETPTGTIIVDTPLIGPRGGTVELVALTARVDTLDTELAAEASTRATADTNEATTRASAVSAEATARSNADSAHAALTRADDVHGIDTELAAIELMLGQKATSTALTAETNRATAAEGDLSDRIDAEELARQDAVDAEATARQDAIDDAVATLLGNAPQASLDTLRELGDAIAAGDTSLQNLINGKQPLAAALTAVAAKSPATFGLNVLEWANAAAGIAALGLGDAATKNTGTGSTQVAAGDDSRFPTTGQKNALAGTAGTPGTTNPFATKQTSDALDSRLTVVERRIIVAGNFGSTYSADMQGHSSGALSGTLDANCALTLTNFPAGFLGLIEVAKDATTTSYTLTINGVPVVVKSTPLALTRLWVYSFDGSTIHVDAPDVDPATVGACAKRTTAQSIANNTIATVTFNTEVWDTDSFVNLGTQATRVTIPPGKGGLYAISAEWAWASNNTGGRYGWIYKNGALPTLVGDYRNAKDESDGAIYHEEPLAAGDYLELLVKQVSGGALNLTADTLGGTYPRLAVRRLGPDPR